MNFQRPQVDGCSRDLHERGRAGRSCCCSSLQSPARLLCGLRCDRAHGAGKPAGKPRRTSRLRQLFVKVSPARIQGRTRRPSVRWGRDFSAFRPSPGGGQLICYPRDARTSSPSLKAVRSEVNNSLLNSEFFHKIQNFRQISDLFSQI